MGNKGRGQGGQGNDAKSNTGNQRTGTGKKERGMGKEEWGKSKEEQKPKGKKSVLKQQGKATSYQLAVSTVKPQAPSRKPRLLGSAAPPAPSLTVCTLSLMYTL